MLTVKERAVATMQLFVNRGTPYSYTGQGHSRSEWTVEETLSDGTVVHIPPVTDCSGAVIAAYENADPGCTGFGSETGSTGDMVDSFLSTGKWEYVPVDGNHQPGDVYVYSKYLHPSVGGHTAMCSSSNPPMLCELVPDWAICRGYYAFNGGWDGKLVYVGSNSESGGAGGAASQIVEDGYWGPSTTAALQRHYGTIVDGEVWHQWAPNIAANPVLLPTSWKCDNTLQGSPLIRALQADLGTAVDGIFGPNDILAIKALFGGLYGNSSTLDVATVWEIQHQLNGGVWPLRLG